MKTAQQRWDFEEGYAKRSDVTVEWLHEQGEMGVPCGCEEKGCRGWQMVSLGALQRHIELSQVEDIIAYDEAEAKKLRLILPDHLHAIVRTEASSAAL